MKMLLCLVTVMLFLTSFQISAGAYLFASETNSVDIVAHPPGYTGAGGVVTVRVCIDPASPDAAEMEYPVQNNIATYNALIPTTDNIKQGANNNIPAGFMDFESVSLHEIGHCLGMAHPNAATESGLSGNDQNYTRATDGADDTYNLSAGVDGIIGSSDDVRGDDQSLMWFRKLNNDPFTIGAIVDSTTYSRQLSDLPAGHNFPANPDRAVSTLLGHVKSEGVMQQGSFFDEMQRTLGHDDVATLRYAASGINERESGGTFANDNYSIVLEYGGISSANCDISMSQTSTSSLAFCSVGGTTIGGFHVAVHSATIEFGDSYNWFYNSANIAPVLDLIGDLQVEENQQLVVPLTATDADVGDTLIYSAIGLPTFATLLDHGDGTAELTLSPAVNDPPSTAVTIIVSDNGQPSMSAQEILSIKVLKLDTDDDGLPDEWELLFNLDPGDPSDAVLDSDGDGKSNLQEFIDGTNPFVDEGAASEDVPLLPVWALLLLATGLALSASRVNNS